MSVADTPAVAELDRLIFGRSAWSADAFTAELTESRISLLYLLQSPTQTTAIPSPPALRGEMSRSDRGGSAPLAHPPVTMETLLGYFVCWTLPNQLHLANFAIHPDHRSRGLGALLLRALYRLAQRLAIATVELEVRQSNVAAQRLYRRHGFEVVGERPNFYEHPTESAILMDGPVPAELGARLPQPLAAAYLNGLRLIWRDRAGESIEHWPAEPG